MSALFFLYAGGGVLLALIAATGLYFWPNITVDGYALSVLGVFVIAFSVAFIQGWRYMKSLR